MRSVNSRFARAYWKVLEDPALYNPSLKLMYTILLDRANYQHRGWSLESYENFEKYGFKYSNAKKLIGQLRKLGYVKTEPSRYYTKVIPMQFYETHIAKVEEDQTVYMKVHGN